MSVYEERRVGVRGVPLTSLDWLLYFTDVAMSDRSVIHKSNGGNSILQCPSINTCLPRYWRAHSPKQRADLPMIMVVAVVVGKQYMFYSLLTHVHARE